MSPKRPNPALHLTPPADLERIASCTTAVQVSFMFGKTGRRWMSSGFTVAGEEFAGTNGAVEAYVETMATLAADRYGAGDPLAAYLAGERDSPARGWTVSLDSWAADTTSRGRLLELLDGATDRLLREGVFTDYGQAWVASVVSALRARVAAVGSAEPGAAPDTVR